MAGGDRFEGRPDPGVGLDAIHFRRIPQRNHPASCAGALIVMREQGVFPTQGNRADQILDTVAVHLDPPVGNEQLRAVPVAGDTVDAGPPNPKALPSKDLKRVAGRATSQADNECSRHLERGLRFNNPTSPQYSFRIELSPQRLDHLASLNNDTKLSTHL